MDFIHLLDSPPKFQFRRGDVLFLQDNPCDGIFYVLKGTAKLFSHQNDGKETILHLVGPGEFAGVSGFLGQKNHPCSAKAMENIQCCYLNNTELQKKLLTDPKISHVLFQKLGKLLDDVIERQARYVRFGVKRKIADCLNELAENFGEETPNGIRIKLQISREEVASLLGVAPETAIRFISEFKRKGLISEENRHIIIKDKEALKHISEFN